MKVPVLLGSVLLLCLLPHPGTDMKNRIPVEILCMTCRENTWQVETDTGQSGSGTTPEAAWKNMEETASGCLFADTASVLLLGNGTEAGEKTLMERLNRCTQVLKIEEPVPLESAAEYLQTRKSPVTLLELERGERPPLLKQTATGFVIEP